MAVAEEPIPTPTPTGPYVDPTPTKTILTYRCDTTVVNARIPFSNSYGTETWSDGATRVSNGGSAALVRQLDAGVEYKMVFDGTYYGFTSEYDAASKAAAPCLRSVDHWGTASNVQSAAYAFSGATNLTDVPDNIPTTITNMSFIFKNATSFNDASISKWNMSKVSSMPSAFTGATSFNQPLNDWNVSSAVNMGNMFNGATSFNQPLNNWNTANVNDMDHMFYGASSFNQPLNNWNTANVTNMHLMFYNTSYSQDLSGWDMGKVARMGYMLPNPESYAVANLQKTTHPTMTKLTYKCDTTVTNAKMPFNSTNGYETWSDGITKLSNAGTGPLTRTLQAGVEYGLFFEGTYSAFSSNYDSSAIATAKCLRSVDHWGSAVAVSSAGYAFDGAMNLTSVPDSIPPTINNMAYMFQGATNFNDPDISKWNVTRGGSMAYMFNGATNFNQPLNTWNTSAVTNMDHMFYGVSNFNQPLNSWNTANVTNMHLMLWGTQFKQDLSSWDMSKVTRMGYMLPTPEAYAVANLQKTTHPTTMKLTYKCDVTVVNAKMPFTSSNGFETWSDGATKGSNGGTGPMVRTLQAGVEYGLTFEGTFGSINSKDDSSTIAAAKCLRSVDYWGTGGGSNMANAFYGATNLTDVPDSIPANINYAPYMFQGATNFNDSSVTKWDVSKLVNTTRMFDGATAFNQDISSWNMTNVTDMSYMFNNASNFNQNISSWNVAKVTNMSYMFAGAANFNQNLSGWNTAVLTNGIKFAPSTFNTNYLPPKTTL